VDGVTAPARQSLRAFLDALEADGDLTRVTATVDHRFELSACLAVNGRGPVLRFDSVRDHDMPVVGNVLGTRERMARAVGVELADLQDHLAGAIERPLAPQQVAAGPCQEVVQDAPDLDRLPLPWFFEHETGPYVTAGAIVAREPATGKRNLSIARLKPLGGNRALIGIAPNHHLAQMARDAGAEGEKLPIAVTLGNHPAVLLAACLYLRYGDDELEQAGALLGEPLEVVAAQRDLLVPAHCELVLEGTLDPAETVHEGLVSEFHGMYEDYGPGYVVTFDRMTSRRDAFLHVIEPGRHPEHLLLGGVAIAAGLAPALRRIEPAVGAIALPEGGCGRLAAVIALDGERARAGVARRLMFATWAQVSLVRTVTVVDADIDPWDAEQVEWARTSFARPDRDLLIAPDASADRAEPLERRGTVAKLGIDAMRKGADRGDHRVAAPPAAAMAAARRLLGR
jgi:4-hydroxy-3-polyprenylbenzoate decarboxylase